jgi:large subunit ribosomal protein L1
MPLDNKTISEAIKQAKAKSGHKKFNQTVDLILDIVEIDMKAPEGKIQEIVELPHVTSKPNKICVVASSGDCRKAKNSKADKVRTCRLTR